MRSKLRVFKRLQSDKVKAVIPFTIGALMMWMVMSSNSLQSVDPISASGQQKPGTVVLAGKPADQQQQQQVLQPAQAPPGAGSESKNEEVKSESAASEAKSQSVAQETSSQSAVTTLPTTLEEARRLYQKELERKLLPELPQPIQPEGATSVTVNVMGFNLTMYDTASSSGGLQHIAREFESGDYGIASLDLKPGDIVLDIGCNVGFFSVAIAKKYPGVKIYCFEPVPRTFAFTRWNIHSNGVQDAIVAINRGLSRDGKPFTLNYHPMNSGGSGKYSSPELAEVFTCETITLSDVIVAFDINQIAMMKVDCEGCEWDFLPTSDVARVKKLRGEIHFLNGFPNNIDAKRLACLAQVFDRQRVGGYQYFTCDDQ